MSMQAFQNLDPFGDNTNNIQKPVSTCQQWCQNIHAGSLCCLWQLATRRPAVTSHVNMQPCYLLTDACLLQGAQQKQMHDIQGLFVTAQATQPEAIMKVLSPEVVQCCVLQNQMEQERQQRCQHMSMPYDAASPTCSLTFCHNSPACQDPAHTLNCIRWRSPSVGLPCLSM